VIMQGNSPLRILGLDPGLQRTGWGIVDVQGTRLSHVAHGVIAPQQAWSFAARLLFLFEKTVEVIATYAPTEAAIEESFLNSNPSTTLRLGHARAAIMLAPAKAGLPVAEYAARYVKKCVVGTGAADKDQIGFMVRRLLPTSGVSSADAADALAVAISHANSRRVAG
jgi:crossover junction endodeoxyribonuclease RuvC